MNKIINYKGGDENQKYQGDIPVIKNVKMKDGLSFEKVGQEYTVALGEVTGHRHRVIPREFSEVEIAQDGVGFYLKINKGSADLVHEEHSTITFDKGLYFIGKQWEFDEEKEYKAVID